ncbi:Putative hemolysin [Andreprevotia lacus DSM 23236]|jgi:putative hemolysin|uniref:L-ornithine N(alpha)-acyltransferase n=1 Tax=Andreprevotia lacus DSM 23236 TaxID=1121001 RepID=A0A1W1WVZ1_9NEIS|nr:GNAT family N-acyltransferase [Andreprevotia lacus]SMC15872.1 Putative hemolysin [Andreprevotia lacus DSM 23236]
MLQQLQSPTSHTRRRPLSVVLAHHEDQIRAAQKLRYKVFAEEMGARLPSREGNIDQDLFDAYCDHLLVQDDETGEVVGTYRILPPAQAKKLGSYYSDTEFDLTRLSALRPELVEIGRSCVHPDYRTGATIALLWSGLAEYMQARNYQYLIGCASVSLIDGGHLAASLYRKLAEKHLGPIEWRVFPRCPLPLAALNQKLDAEIPPLIKGYLRAGAMICGEPAWDPDFNTADLFVLLPMQKVDQRYARHFIR